MLISNEIPNNIISNTIIEEALARFKQFQKNATEIEEFEEVIKDLNIAMFLGNNKACFHLVECYSWAQTHLGREKKLCKYFHKLHQEIIYIGSKLGNKDCLKIIEYQLQKETKKFDKELNIIIHTQNYYNETFLHSTNKEEIKKIIYDYYYDVRYNENYYSDGEEYTGGCFDKNDSGDEKDVAEAGNCITENYTCTLL